MAPEFGSLVKCLITRAPSPDFLELSAVCFPQKIICCDLRQFPVLCPGLSLLLLRSGPDPSPFLVLASSFSYFQEISGTQEFGLKQDSFDFLDQQSLGSSGVDETYSIQLNEHELEANSRRW